MSALHLSHPTSRRQTSEPRGQRPDHPSRLNPALSRAIAEGVGAGCVVGLTATALAYALFDMTVGLIALPASILFFVATYTRSVKE